MSQGMNPNKRSKMTRQERAKQFMPFSALKGYEEAIKKVEDEVDAGNLEPHFYKTNYPLKNTSEQ